MLSLYLLTREASSNKVPNVSLHNCGINNAHKNPHGSFKRAEKTQNCEHQMSFTSLWLNSRLKDFHKVQEHANRTSEEKVMVVRSRSYRFAWVLENCSNPKTKNYTHGQHSVNPHHNSPGLVPGLIIHGYGQAKCLAQPNRNQGYTRVAKSPEFQSQNTVSVLDRQ